jgi:hypothetical protein
VKLSRHLTWILIAIGALLWWLASRPIASATVGDVRWLDEPRQVDTDGAPFVVETRRGQVQLHPRATFEVSAVVVGSERYRLDDSAFLSPLDLALAWGDAASPEVRRRVHVYQAARFFSWSTRDSSLDLGRLSRQQANVHVIPATPNVRRALLGIGRDDAVRLAGLLVDAQAADGFRWGTSLSRTDSGMGSCELLWVEEAQVGQRVYR